MNTEIFKLDQLKNPSKTKNRSRIAKKKRKSGFTKWEKIFQRRALQRIKFTEICYEQNMMDTGYYDHWQSEIEPLNLDYFNFDICQQ